jgi:negative regulator of flagellin synthesis FlgM
MRIDPNARSAETQAAGEAAASKQRGAVSPAGGGRTASDTAQLSLDQARVQALVSQATALPEVRQEKVAALGRAIRQGSYQVSPEQTAEAMLSEMLTRSAA